MRILILSTWFPYPPSNGAKMRAYGLIRALASEHETALLSFADEEIAAEWVDHMRGICAKVELVNRSPFQANRFKKLLGFFSLLPAENLARYSTEMEARVQALASEWQPDVVFAFTLMTAPYALRLNNCRKVVDVDSVMWRYLKEHSQQEASPAARLRREAAWRKMLRYERQLYKPFDLCLLAAEKDCSSSIELLGLRSEQVTLIPNGIDPETHQAGLYLPEPDTMIYNGSITYEPNYEAVRHFLAEIFPRIRAEIPGARLTVTGKTGGREADFSGAAGVRFSGHLDDIRPVVGGNWACVVPLMKGGGTRLKILEAMALGTPVISTSKGAEGLDAQPGRHLLISDTPEDFAAQTVRLLRDPHLRRCIAGEAAQFVQNRYFWPLIGARLCEEIRRITTAAPGSGRA